MIISKNWLSDFVKLDVDTKTLCEKLTSLGLEVEGVSVAAPQFSGVVVGKVLGLSPHPDADKLQIAEVDIAEEAPLQIVCGATNIFVGGVFPVATIGAVLPGDFKIKKSKLRGVESFGMLCSAKELGLADDSTGLLVLEDVHTLGQNVRQALDLDDELIEIGLTPNRGDCLSMLGVAREVAAGFSVSLDEPFAEVSLDESDESSPTIKLLAPEACPKYISRKISGINNSVESPLWMKERLRRAGIRSLSAIVDITNYVMLELGVPMHSFSAKEISGDIQVRLAKQDELFTLLDGKEIKLDSDMLVVADDEGVIALAGIMGGKNSAVQLETNSIVLESAWFNHQAIIGRARRIGLSTDASYRFERGVDYQLQQKAIDRAASLIVEICGGSVAKQGIACDEAYLPKNKLVQLTHKKIDTVLGVRFPKKQIIPFLTSLGMTVAEVDKGVYDVIYPSHRFDINREEDLIEELARLWGYDNIPVAPVVIHRLDKQSKSDSGLSEKNIHTVLNSIGYSEAICYSFIDEKSSALLSDDEGSIALLNPISEELKVMRTSLIPSLAKTLVYNVNRQQKNISLYEVSNAYKRVDGQVVQTRKLSAITYGLANPIQWGYRDRGYDFFDIKGDLELLFEKLGIMDQISYERGNQPFLHSGQAANILYNSAVVGFIGTLHPSIQKDLDLDYKAYVFEIDLGKIPTPKLSYVSVVGKYPVIRRDISVLMAQSYPVQDVIKAIRSVAGDLVRQVELFDVYVGRNIPRGTKSLAIAIFLQDNGKTLEDEQADEVIGKVMDCLKEQFNAQLRG